MPSVSVTTFFTASRAHLRRAGPDVLAVHSEDGREQSRGKSGKGDPPYAAGVHPGLAVAGGSFRRVLRTQVLRRGGYRAQHPGDRPPAVLAVSRCRARQRHRQAVIVATSVPVAGRMSLPAGRNAAHCPGWLLQPQQCFASRCAGRACGAPLTLETSASPAGLTARARPEARPEVRAANLHRWHN